MRFKRIEVTSVLIITMCIVSILFSSCNSLRESEIRNDNDTKPVTDQRTETKEEDTEKNNANDQDEINLVSDLETTEEETVNCETIFIYNGSTLIGTYSGGAFTQKSDIELANDQDLFLEEFYEYTRDDKNGQSVSLLDNSRWDTIHYISDYMPEDGTGGFITLNCLIENETYMKISDEHLNDFTRYVETYINDAEMGDTPAVVKNVYCVNTDADADSEYIIEAMNVIYFYGVDKIKSHYDDTYVPSEMEMSKHIGEYVYSVLLHVNGEDVSVIDETKWELKEIDFLDPDLITEKDLEKNNYEIGKSGRTTIILEVDNELQLFEVNSLIKFDEKNNAIGSLAVHGKREDFVYAIDINGDGIMEVFTERFDGREGYIYKMYNFAETSSIEFYLETGEFQEYGD